MNIARWFAAYRLLERENERLADALKQAEAKRDEAVNYSLRLLGAPPMVAPIPQSDPKLVPPRPSLMDRKRDLEAQSMNRKIEQMQLEATTLPKTG